MNFNELLTIKLSLVKNSCRKLQLKIHLKVVRKKIVSQGFNVDNETLISLNTIDILKLFNYSAFIYAYTY